MKVYELIDTESCQGLRIRARDLEHARQKARALVRNWHPGDPHTVFFEILIVRHARGMPPCGEQVDRMTIPVRPKPPRCLDGHRHEWEAPHYLVGGLEENPGVRGNGGGVFIREACVLCGCGKLTNTWDTNPMNGTQGWTTVSYQVGEYTDMLKEKA